MPPFLTPRCTLLVALLAATSACHLPASAAAPTGSGALVQRRLGAMGTWLDLEVEAPTRAQALALSEEAVQAVGEVEARLSTWTPEGELARLNRAPVGTEVRLSRALSRDLERARELSRSTEGAFDPALGALVEAWGLRRGGRQPGRDELAAARAAGGLSGFAFVAQPDQTLRVRRLHAAARLEEGAFGKGVGLDAALARLKASGASAAWIDLGGQVAFFGAPERTLVLSHPGARERAVLELTIASGSVATSGNAERGIVVDGERRSHLLDPRTGAPAPERGSVTAWALDATTADALSTALYVLGPDEAWRWHASPAAAALGPHEFLFLEETSTGLQVLASTGWRGRLRSLVPDLSIRFQEPIRLEP